MNPKLAKIVAVLWLLWSLLHIFPGLFAMYYALSGDISTIGFLFPETRPSQLAADYALEVKAILVTFGQHGFNLLWFGLVALAGSVQIWLRPNRTTITVCAVVIGLADLGAIFATILVGRIDVTGVLIFSGTAVGLTLSYVLLRSEKHNMIK
ncbi:MAG: hypothetical protein AAF660_14625 [Pseudomonadota bacterium]